MPLPNEKEKSEHLEWCRNRAMYYIDEVSPPDVLKAASSFMSDIRKGPPNLIDDLVGFREPIPDELSSVESCRFFLERVRLRKPLLDDAIERYSLNKEDGIQEVTEPGFYILIHFKTEHQHLFLYDGDSIRYFAAKNGKQELRVVNNFPKLDESAGVIFQLREGVIPHEHDNQDDHR